MTPEQLTLARKLTRHWRWQWMPGMEASWEHVPRGAGGQAWRPTRARVEDLGGLPNDWERMVVCASAVPPGSAPAVTDPATIGCIAHLAIEAWGATPVYVRRSAGGRWYVVSGPLPGMQAGTPWRHPYDTPGEAWATALLAAPEPQP